MLIPIDNRYKDNKAARKDLFEKIYYISEKISLYSYENGNIKVEFKDSPDDESLKLIEKEILNASKSIIQSFEKTKLEIIYENNIIPKFYEDPLTYLIESENVIQVSPGLFSFQKKFLEIINFVESQIKSFAVDDLQSVEQEYQSLLPMDSLIKNGYINSFPHHIMFASNVQRNKSKIKEMTNAVNFKTNKLKREVLGKIETPHWALSPTVCYHTFELLRDKKINRNVIFTALSKCGRNENCQENDLTRLRNFTMREIIFLGTEEFVENCRKDILSFSINFFENLGLKFRVVTASDPFFVNGSELKRVYQTAFMLKYELQILLPFSDNWVAVASFNNHQNSIVKSYKINSDRNLFSGCVGFGYERIVYSIFSQLGMKCNFPKK